MNKIPEEILYLSIKEKTNKPENDALRSYMKDGWIGVNDEGEMLFLIIKSAFFIDIPKTVYELSRGEDGNENYFGVHHRRITEQMKLAPADRYWPFSEWGLVEARIDDMSKVTLDNVLENFNLIKNNTYCRSCGEHFYLYYENYTDKQVAEAFNALGNDSLIEIFRIACWEYGDDVRHVVGWPDLMLWRNNEIIFREVKTKNDKIRKNQVDVYKAIFERVVIDYKILRVFYN